jgi:hypothetical protein
MRSARPSIRAKLIAGSILKLRFVRLQKLKMGIGFQQAGVSTDGQFFIYGSATARNQFR